MWPKVSVAKRNLVFLFKWKLSDAENQCYCQKTCVVWVQMGSAIWHTMLSCCSGASIVSFTFQLTVIFNESFCPALLRGLCHYLNSRREDDYGLFLLLNNYHFQNCKSYLSTNTTQRNLLALCKQKSKVFTLKGW